MELNWKEWFFDLWEDNRRLTNKVAKTLVETDAIDKVVVHGMRPFRELLLEIFTVEKWNISGLAYDKWDFITPPESLRTGPIEAVLDFGNDIRIETRKSWEKIPFESLTKLRPSPNPFVPAGNAIGWLTYALENEIHHRGQGYVYLRLLGQDPPAFYIRTE